MATNTMEPPVLATATAEQQRPPTPARVWGLHPSVTVLSPAVLALASLAVHWYLPVKQELIPSWMDKLEKWQHPYPVLLETLFAVSVLAALVQAAWRPLRPWVRHYAPLLAGALAIACLVEIITAKTAYLPLPYFPGPDQVLGALIDDRGVLFGVPSLDKLPGAILDDRDAQFGHTWHSLGLLFCGYAVGVVGGLAAGVLIGWFAHARYWGMPLLKVLGPLPATALVALAMMLPLPEFYCGVALIAWAVFFPVTMLTSSGIMNVRVSHLDVARTLGAGRGYLIFRVAVPSALPNMFVGMFIGLVVSFLTLLVAESVGVRAGLGFYIPWKKGYAEYAYVWAALIIVAAFCSSLMTLLFKLRDWMLRWQKGVIKW